VTTVIDDVNGDVEMISLFNFQDSFCGDPNGWLPEGQIMITKEPDRNVEAFESAKSASESGSPEVNREKAFYRLAASSLRYSSE
jgi:hypothetical protein